MRIQSDIARDFNVLVQAMSAAVAEEYGRLAAAAREAQAADPVSRRRTLGRLRRELRRITSRDYFGCAEQRAAKAAVERLAIHAEEAQTP